MILVDIGGERQQIRIGSFALEDAIDERSTCNLAVINKEFDREFFKGQPVEVRSYDLIGDSDFQDGKMETVELESEEYFIQSEFVLDLDINKGELLFSGVIDTVEGVEWFADGPLFYDIECIDWHYAADKRLVAKAYEDEYAGDIVIDLWENYLKGEDILIATAVTVTFTHSTNKVNATAHGLANDTRIRFYTDNTLPAELSTGIWYYIVNAGTDDFEISATEGGSAVAFTDDGTGTHSIRHSFSVDDGPEITDAVFNYVPIADALNSIAERTGLWWKIDENRRLHFKKRDSYTAPWTITGTDILHGSLQVTHNADKYRNRQVVRGGRDETTERSEVRVGDGENQAFTMSYPVARVPTVEVDFDDGAGYVAQTVGIKGLDEGRQWYWSKGDPVIAQDAGDTVLTAVQSIKVTYRGQFPIIVITQDSTAITERAAIEDVGTGRVEQVKQVSQDTTRDGAFDLANDLIEKFSKIGKTVRFRTMRHGLRAGHIATVNLPAAGLNNTEVLIDAITVGSVANNFLYDVQGVEGPEVGSWTKFFKDIAIGGDIYIREGIGEDETIIEPYSFSKTWLSTEDPNIFIEVYPDDVDPLYDDTHGLSFAPEDRVKYLEWHFSGVAEGRKLVTQATGLTEGATEIFTLTYLEAYEALGVHTHLAWIGGIDATATLGTGIEVDKQAHAETKSETTSWQIEKTDTKWV